MNVRVGPDCASTEDCVFALHRRKLSACFANQNCSGAKIPGLNSGINHRISATMQDVSKAIEVGKAALRMRSLTKASE